MSNLYLKEAPYSFNEQSLVCLIDSTGNRNFRWAMAGVASVIEEDITYFRTEEFQPFRLDFGKYVYACVFRVGGNATKERKKCK